MIKEHLEAITYSQYTAWLYDVYMKIPNSSGMLTYNEALERAKEERVLRKKEERSLIKKILRNLGIIPCNLQHVYEHYDLALTLMNHMNKNNLTRDDIDLAREISFYDEFFKCKLVDYQRYYFSYERDNMSKKEYKQCKRIERELFEKAIPPYGNFDYNLTLNN